MWWDGGKQDARLHQPLHNEAGLRPAARPRSWSYGRDEKTRKKEKINS